MKFQVDSASSSGDMFDMYSGVAGTNQTSRVEFFEKIVSNFKPLTSFTKKFHLGCFLGIIITSEKKMKFTFHLLVENMQLYHL